MSKFFPVSQKNIFPVSHNFSLCQSKIPCVFPVWKKLNQIPCFPCAVATLYRLDIFSTTKAVQPIEIVKIGFHKAVMYRTICIYLHKVVIPLTQVYLWTIK